MAWQTTETFRRAVAMSVENILNYFRGEPSHVANPDAFKNIDGIIRETDHLGKGLDDLREIVEGICKPRSGRRL
jgi:hypothetical protein